MTDVAALLATGSDAEIIPVTPAHAVDDVVPRCVAQPRTAGGVAGLLRRASERDLAVLVQGRGTKRRWGRPPRTIDVLLSTAGLDRLLEHREGDLIVSVEAGMTLQELNSRLAGRGQYLPLDPPHAETATIGGIVAANDSGPLRHRCGSPRDLILGVQIVTGDGVLAKAGGNVVKNVAGYDLSKLVCGSFGSLAVVVSATFKLLPLPAATATALVSADDPDHLGRIVQAIGDSPLEALSFDVHARLERGEFRELRALLRFAGLPSVVDAQTSDAVARLAGAGAAADVRSGDAEHQLWRRQGSAVAGEPGVVLGVSWLPASLQPLLSELQLIAGDLDVELAGRAALGAGLLRLDGDASAAASAIERLRASTVAGNVVIRRASAEFRQVVDPWGPSPHPGLFERIKAALDPRGILGAGRGQG